MSIYVKYAVKFRPKRMKTFDRKLREKNNVCRYIRDFLEEEKMFRDERFSLPKDTKRFPQKIDLDQRNRQEKDN